MSGSQAPTTAAGQAELVLADAANRRRRIVRAVALGVVAVLAAAALTWQIAPVIRTQWWEGEAHSAIEPDADGWATHAGISASLVDLEPALNVSTWDGPYSPPDGFRLWRVGVSLTSTNTELVTCDVTVQDQRGRHFLAGANVPHGVEGVEDSTWCGMPDADDEPLPDVQYSLVLMPTDATPQSVRLSSTWGLDPYYFEFPVSE